MVRVASLFSQLLQQIPRDVFQGLVQKHRSERYAKGFSSWTHLVAMLFSQLAHADSLREICNGLACCEGKLLHLGVNEPPHRSTLSYANNHRPAAMFEELFWKALDRFRRREMLGRHRSFRFKNRLLSLDSSTISLCLSLFPWAQFRQTKGGVKLHVLLSHEDYMPEFALLTNARQHDIRPARQISLRPGSIVVMDRGYTDFTLFGKWCQEGVFWVTRMKDGTAYRVEETRPLPKNRPILADEVVVLCGAGAEEKCPDRLRRIVVWDAEQEREIVILTNHLEFGATTLGDIYRQRWQIELFFKALKQNLKVKSFVGTSENALRIQIWTALLALLLLKWLHFLSLANWSLSNLASLLRLNLFTYRDLKEWLAKPLETPPLLPPPEQLALPLPLGQLSS
jgi:IS4 transposase